MKRRLQASEQQILKAIQKRLLLDSRVAWIARLNSGGFKDSRGQYVRFGFPGLSDLIGQCTDGRLLAIEVKSATGSLTVLQADFLERVRVFHGRAGVARSIEDALAIVALP